MLRDPDRRVYELQRRTPGFLPVTAGDLSRTPGAVEDSGSLTLPIGANCRLDADKQTVYITESAVREIC